MRKTLVARIILTGTYNSKNKGDAAMELSTANALASASPGAKLCIHCPFPDMDGPFYSPIPVIRCSRRRLIWGSFLVLRGWLWSRFGVPFFIRGNAELESYAQADIVVDLSGDMQTESYGPHVAYSHFIPLALAIAMNKPVILCAQSIGPFKWTASIARFLFNRVDMITVRDRISETYLEGMKIKSPVIYTADMAFLLEPSTADHVDKIFEKEGIPKDLGPLLGVSVSGLIATHFLKHNPLSAKTDFYRFMAAELDTVIEKLDMDCVFVAHVTGPSKIKDDRKAADRVRKHMMYAHRSYVLRGDYRPEELKGIISRFWIHTGSRMHASIAAVTTSVPVASIAYSHKTPGVMAQFGLKKYVLDISLWDHGELLEKLNSIRENRSEIETTLSQQVLMLKKQSMANINHILSMINVY